MVWQVRVIPVRRSDMEALILIFIMPLAAFGAGYLIGTFGTRKANPHPHRLADDWYYVFYPEGEPCALTNEAVQEGILRAKRLKIK